MYYYTTDISYWIAAIHLEGIGPIHIHQWLKEVDDLKTLFSLSVPQLQKLKLTARQIHALKTPHCKAVQNDMRWAEQEQSHIVAYDSEKYPALLREIPDAPLVLFVRGN